MLHVRARGRTNPKFAIKLTLPPPPPPLPLPDPIREEAGKHQRKVSIVAPAEGKRVNERPTFIESGYRVK